MEPTEVYKIVKRIHYNESLVSMAACTAGNGIWAKRYGLQMTYKLDVPTVQPDGHNPLFAFDGLDHAQYAFKLFCGGSPSTYEIYRAEAIIVAKADYMPDWLQGTLIALGGTVLCSSITLKEKVA